MNGPAYHGRTHGKHGTDPVPFESSRTPWILFQGDLNGFTAVTATDSYPQLTGLLAAPVNNGGNVDAAIYGGISPLGAKVAIMTGAASNEPFKAVEILQPGLYSVEILSEWHLNWGMVRVNYEITHSDLNASAVTFRYYVHGAENSYFGGASDATAPQIALTARTLLAVDSRATDVHVRYFIHNTSGVNRTFGSTPATDGGTFQLGIVQLSDDPSSNPR